MPASPSTTDESKPMRAAWAAPVGLAVAVAFYNLVLSPLHSNWAGPSEWLATLCIGVFFVQPLLLAAWAALGPGALVYRLPVTAVTLIAWIFAQSVVSLNVFAGDFARNKLNVEMTLVFVTAFPIAVAAIGVVRRLSGIHISRCERSSPPPQHGRHQFGMKYLLGWMTVCALLIVVGRSFDSDTSGNGQPWPSRLSEVAAGLAFMLLLMMPPAVLPLLALTRPTPWRWLLTICAAWPLSTWAAVEIMNTLSRGGPPQNVFETCAGLQIGATAMALGSALVLRLAGFRLTGAVDSTSNIKVAEPAR